VTPLIVTSRLELRPFRPADADAAELHEIFSDPETHTIGQEPFTSLAQTAAWISRRAETERQAVLDEALASGIGRVWATIRPRNTASLRVAAKIGMPPRHTRPDSRGHPSGPP
jgi:[ribosomal protein S5]-alanine N-acetyltransferase